MMSRVLRKENSVVASGSSTFTHIMKYVTCTFEIWILYTLFLAKL